MLWRTSPVIWFSENIINDTVCSVQFRSEPWTACCSTKNAFSDFFKENIDKGENMLYNTFIGKSQYSQTVYILQDDFVLLSSKKARKYAVYC